MNPPLSKAEKRAQLNNQIEQFLSKGGQVASVPQGVSGRENPTQALVPALFTEKAAPRTDARNALQSLDSRKNKKNTSHTLKRPRKKPVYDDFGELLRWVWVDE